MKKKKFLFVVIVVSMMIAQSFQNLSCQIFRELTFDLSVGKSSIVGETDSWKDPVGFQIGANVPVAEINKSISIRAEVCLSLQGARWEEFMLSGRTDLIYINAPMVFRYMTKSGFYGEAGLQPGILLSAIDKYEGETDNYKEFLNTFDLAVPLGAGYEFKNNFGVGIRIIPGITNINKEGPAKDRNFLAVIRGTYSLKIR